MLRSDLGIVAAFPTHTAEFRFGTQPRNGAWCALGKRLLPIAARLGGAPPPGWLAIDLSPEEAQTLGLPESVGVLGQTRGVRIRRDVLLRHVEGPGVLRALIHLGFASAPRPALLRSRGPARDLLAGALPLDALLPEDALQGIAPLDGPQEILLGTLRARARRKNWAGMLACFSDYVGPVDSAELAAWRALCLLRVATPVGPSQLSAAEKWFRLSKGLPQCARSRQLLVQVRVEFVAAVDALPG